MTLPLELEAALFDQFACMLWNSVAVGSQSRRTATQLAEVIGLRRSRHKPARLWSGSEVIFRHAWLREYGRGVGVVWNIWLGSRGSRRSLLVHTTHLGE